MKKPWKKSVQALFILALYIAGLALGTFFVGLCPLLRHKGFLISLAEDAAGKYNAGRWIEDNLHPNILFMLYDTDGNVLERTDPPNVNMNYDFSPWIEKHLDTVVVSSKTIFYYVFFRDDRNGKLIHSTLLLVPLYQDGDITGAVFVARRLVDLMQTVYAFLTLYTVLFTLTAYYIMRLKKKEYELERIRRDYIANISHTLKSPIASVMVLSEALRDGLVADGQTRNRYYEIIHSEAKRLDYTVKDMLELSKMQSGKINCERSRIASSELFESICEKYQTLCDDIDISFSISDSISQMQDLYTNAELITWLMEIFLDNAVKFAGKNGVIELDAECDRKKATICVRDKGIGIADDDLPHIFERFFTVNHAYGESGNGLGLAIAKDIVLLLNEKLWVESKPGKGAAFYFTIQIWDDTAHSTQPAFKKA